ncbi:MAG: hypothetical protein ACKV2Q_14570 [Planctomycetaceae bacterium]
MSGWLSRAKGAFGGREAEVDLEPIEIVCPCGRKVEATRRLTFQRVLCKGCGESFFLLPKDVYPRPVMKVRKAKPPTQSATKTPTESKTPLATKTSSATKPPSSAKTKTPFPQPLPQPSTQTESDPNWPRINIPRMLAFVARKLTAPFTPLRLIVLSLLTVIGLTGWWQWDRAARSEAEWNFKTATEAGLTALQKKDYVDAAQHFARATDAVDLLQRHDVLAEQTRQQLRQLTAINSLLTRSLGDILEAAQAGRKKGDVGSIESEFASLHAGRWIVLQSEVESATGAPDRSIPIDPATSSTSVTRNVWEQRMFLDGEGLVLTGSLSIFTKVRATAPPPAVPAGDAAPAGGAAPEAQLQLLFAINDLGQHEIVFAAQVESLKWNADQSVWVLTLKSSSGFLWTDYDLLLETGLQPDELRTEPQLRALLLEQSRWIGAAQ